MPYLAEQFVQILLQNVSAKCCLDASLVYILVERARVCRKKQKSLVAFSDFFLLQIKVERLLTWFEHVSGSEAIPVVNVGKIFSFVIDTLGEHA